MIMEERKNTRGEMNHQEISDSLAKRMHPLIRQSKIWIKPKEGGTVTMMEKKTKGENINI